MVTNIQKKNLNNHGYAWLVKGGIGEGLKIGNGRGSQ